MAKSIPTFSVTLPDGSGHRVINQADYLTHYAMKGYIIKDPVERETYIARNEGKMRDNGILREHIDPDFVPAQDTEPDSGAEGGTGDELDDTPPDADYPNGKDPIDPPMKEPSIGEGPLSEPLGGIGGSGGDADEDSQS